jgi:hypothetical protein
MDPKRSNMKVNKVYEVWVGGDLIEDGIELETALKLAEKFFKEESEKEDPVDVVIDEHSYIEIEEWADFDKIGV